MPDQPRMTVTELRAILAEHERQMTKAFGSIGELQREVRILKGIINLEQGRSPNRRLKADDRRAMPRV